MANYIPLDSDPQIPPPYNFPGVTIQSFRLPAQLAQQQLLVDTYLNIGDIWDRGFYYAACMPFVDMDFVYYPSMSYGLPPLGNMGSMSQNELYFKIYVVKFVVVLDVFWLPVPAIIGFFPYMFVDNSWSMVAGRDVSGFPKLMASFDPSAPTPNQPLRPYPISLSTLGFANIGPGAQAGMLPFVSIAPLPPGVNNTIVIANNWPFSPGDLNQLSEPVASALQSADSSMLRTVQLKQFRTAGSSTSACYQAIVEGQFSVSNLNPLIPPPAQISINQLASLSIAASLGLGASPITPISQYAASCNLLYTQEQTIFVND